MIKIKIKRQKDELFYEFSPLKSGKVKFAIAFDEDQKDTEKQKKVLLATVKLWEHFEKKMTEDFKKFQEKVTIVHPDRTEEDDKITDEVSVFVRNMGGGEVEFIEE